MTLTARRVVGACLLLVACSTSPTVLHGPVEDVAQAARAFVDGLPAAQRERATRPFADAERTTWAYVPGRYQGVEFGDLDAPAMARAHELLHALLSASGYAKTTAIVGLESVLHEIESRGGGDATQRDPGRYTLLVCGDPTPRGTFAVRMQGHHVSLHFTFCDGELVGATPHFLGSNPHELRDGARAGQRVLGAEEDLARALLASLDATQRNVAVVAGTAPADILLRPGATFDAVDAAQGLAAGAMSEAQRASLWALVEVFTHNLRGEFAAQELARLSPQRDGLHFVWIGGGERGQGHYWRVQGRTFAIEYDNTQNEANHVHVVWHDLKRDFGADPLREHLAHDHAAAATEK